MRVTKKIVCWFVLPIVVLLSSLSIDTALAENSTFQQVLPLYTVPPVNDKVAERIRLEHKQRLIRLQTGAYGKPDYFTSKARLAFKTEKRSMVTEARAFTLGSPIMARDWRKKETLYSWRSNMATRAIPLIFPLAPENGVKPLVLGNFNEFWLDYTHSPQVPLCTPQIKFQASTLPYHINSGVLRDVFLRTDGSSHSLKPVANIDTSRAVWKEKESLYLLGRVLGLVPDEDWRYVQSQENGVMQRRLHMQINNIEALDIVVAPGTNIERVNLMISDNDDYRAGEIIEFTGVQHITLPDGRSSIRLNLREVLERRFSKKIAENFHEPENFHFYLQEIFIFIPGEARAISEKKPVRNLIFLGENSGSYYSLKPVANIDTSRAVWKERESLYLLGRVFGLAPDKDWRYVQSQENGVMQRRLHMQINNIEALDIALAPGTVVEKVSLVVSQHDNYRAGNSVLFAHQPHITLLDGQSGIRLNLREVLERRFSKEILENLSKPGKNNFFLQEISIFISGEARAISEKKPVRSLVFLGEDMGEFKQKNDSIFHKITLATRIIGENKFRQRMVVSLPRLAEKGLTNMKKATLLLVPPEGEKSCAINIEGMQIVSTYNPLMPKFASVVEDFSQRWGIISSLFSPQDDQVESPGIIGYLPLSALTQDARQSSTVGVEIKLGANNQLQSQLVPAKNNWLPYRIVGLNEKEIAPDNKYLVSSGGASLRAEGAMPLVTTKKDLLVLEGRSERLEITWPLAARINEKTRFYFDVSEGVEQIGSIGLTLDLADGSVVKRQVVPNQQLHLVTSEVEVQNVRLHIVPAVTPYRFKLRDIALFETATVSYAQTFNVQLPTQFSVLPKLVLQSAHESVLEVEPGRIFGLAADLTAGEPLRFFTRLDPELDWVSGIRLDYRLPPTYWDSEGCPLTLKFNWVNGKTTRQVCFEKPDGSLYIPMANFIGSTEKPQNLGALKSINWVFWSATGGDKGAQESFDLQFSVDGWASVSAADHLRLLPLFYAGKSPISVDIVNSKELAMGSYAQKIWLPLIDITLPRMLDTGGEIQLAENWLFDLDQVAVEPRQPVSWDRWDELVTTPVPYAPPRWPIWLVLFSVIFVLWVALIRGWWSFVFKRGSIKVLTRIFHWVLVVAVRWGRYVLPKIYLVIGALVLGPVLWMAGQFGSSFAGIMLLATSVLLAWGVYCHWCDQMRQHRLDNNFAIHTRVGVLAAGLGCAIWSVGQYKLGAEMLWGFLPLLAAIYMALPVLYRLGLQLVLNYRYRNYVLLGWWLVLSLALYGGGLLVKVDSGENYFFTFGALMLTFALPAGLLALKPLFSRSFPAAAGRVYGGSGSLYFSVALFMLVATAAMLSVKLEPIAEQLAVVAYYCLVIGTVQAIWALRNGEKKTVEISNSE